MQALKGALILIFFNLTVSVAAQKKWQKEFIRVDPPVCYASDESAHTEVLPPVEFLNRLKSGVKHADIVVKYTDLPDSLKPAVEYAVEIWESLIHSPVPIHLEVRWQVLGNSTLGSCGATGYYIDFEGAPQADTYYPVALAEKLTEKEITGPGNPDMIARFNSGISWYTGTDRKTPGSRYDFVTIVLHEIAHGLGFTGFFNVTTSNSTGYYGNDDDSPAIFDRYVEAFNRNRLTDKASYANSSKELYQALISNQLYSGSPVAFSWGKGSRPRLYAPTTFSEGSSIYHLNDLSYLPGNENSLMTSSAGRGEAIHSPGALSYGVMADLGWKHLYIRHLPLKDMEEVLQPLKFEASVTSETGIRDNSTWLVFSNDGFQSHRDSVHLVWQDSIYRASLQPFFSLGVISYFITTSDTLNRKFFSPVNAPEKYYTITIGPDTKKPDIDHQPVDFILSTDKEFEIRANVTDNIGIDTVLVFFTIHGEELPAKGLVRDENDSFTGRFGLSDMHLKGGDSIEYYIVATDMAKARNTRYLPSAGKFSVKVEGLYDPVFQYSTDFNVSNSDFVLSDFGITTISGFDNAALHSPHPYPSPDKDNTSFDFSTILRYPVILKNNGRMSYDEVVLVEPGEEGSVFGGDQFWDYVIAEGSKDFGKTWLPLLNGYDSGSKPSWKTIYNQNIIGNNSASRGIKDMFINRNFSLTENDYFREGDTILVRFRLYSDPYAHGWGWAIDNLKIQENLTFTEPLAASPGKFLAWPNPVHDVLNMIFDFGGESRNATVEIIDLTGRPLKSISLVDPVPGETIRISLHDIPQGVFFVVLKQEGEGRITRKIIRQ